MTPPSAKDYAAQIVAAKFVGKRQRLSLLPHELGGLIALAYDAGVLAQQRFTEPRSLFDELREKIGIATTSGREPVAVCVSDDVWRRLRSEAEAMRYVTLDNPTTHLPETAMGLPVEHVGGVNHLSVRVRGDTPKG